MTNDTRNPFELALESKILTNLCRYLQLEYEPSHLLKTIDPWYSHVACRLKTGEIRKFDRDFYVGQYIYLAQYDPISKRYTGEVTKIQITHITTWKDFPAGLQPGYGLLSFEIVAVILSDASTQRILNNEV